MQYSRRELLDIFLDYVGENEDANARNTAERLLNFAVQTIWSKTSWRQFVMPDPYTFSTVPGVASYALPQYFGRVRDGRIRNLTTGEVLFPADMDMLDVSPGTPQGHPQAYAIAGVMGVDKQVLPAGEVVTVRSTDSRDTNVRAEIEGLDGRGRYQRMQVTMGGQLPVTFSNLLSPHGGEPWTKVIVASKSVPTGTAPVTELTSSIGNVIFEAVTSGVILELLPYESAVERIPLTLWPTPNIVNTISVPMLRVPKRLLLDTDITPLGWGPALLEEMDAMWKVNTGQIPSTASLPRPALTDLICLENSNRFGVHSRTRPFRG